MQNNPMINQLAMLARNGGNPMQMLQRLAPINPQAAQAMRMIQGKSPQQLQTMAQNMAKERGIDINQMIRELGIANPSRR